MDFIRNGHVFIGPVLQSTRAARQAVDREPALIEVQRALDSALVQIEQAQHILLTQGRVSEAATAFDSGVDALASAQALAARKVPELRAQSLLRDPESGGESGRYDELVRQIDAALASGKHAQPVIASILAAVAAAILIIMEAMPAKTAEAPGLLIMPDGTTLAMPLHQYAPIAEGARVRLTVERHRSRP